MPKVFAMGTRLAIIMRPTMRIVLENTGAILSFGPGPNWYYETALGFRVWSLGFRVQGFLGVIKIITEISSLCSSYVTSSIIPY